MYKRQVRLQKVFCLLALIASAVVFLYSLGLTTDLYDALFNAMPFPNSPEMDIVDGARIFYDIQPFNNQLMLSGLGLIILSLGLYLTQTQSRRRYYIGNYLSTGIWCVAAVAVCIWMHIQVEAFKAQFMQVDFETLAAEFSGTSTLILTANDTFWFDIHYAVMAVVLVMVVVLVANLFWKVSLMKQEAALLAGAPAKEQGRASAQKI